ncbi:hypothetical protein L1887_36667 [Cichorium endivia]|nr:hypothetical protein L1887_36667 [Cichorium endivia]
MEAVNKPRNISYKGLTDLVTDTDKMSLIHLLIIFGAYCIDPLDGTTNFAHGYPSFAVSVGVLFKGKPAAAAVVEFVRGAMCWNTHTFTVVAGGGVLCNGQKIHVSQTDKVLEALLPKGNHSLVTKVVENGLQFHVDLATVYWSSKLATERQRLLNSFTQSDVVFSGTGDVFSGVGPLAISAAKKVKHVYANDLNPHAIYYLERNCVLNKLERKIEVSAARGDRDILGAAKTASGKTLADINLHMSVSFDLLQKALNTKLQGTEVLTFYIFALGFGKQTFGQQAEVILVDGQLTKACITQLNGLQRQFGLASEYAQVF